MAAKKKKPTRRKSYTRVTSPGTSRIMVRVRNETLAAIIKDAKSESRSMASQAGFILDGHYHLTAVH